MDRRAARVVVGATVVGVLTLPALIALLRRRARRADLEAADVARVEREEKKTTEDAESDSESIRAWLDQAVKAGYGAKFASAFEALGIEDMSDLCDIECVLALRVR